MFGKCSPVGQPSRPRQTSLLGNRIVGHALAGQQDDRTPANNSLRRGAGPQQGFQLPFLPFVDSQSGGRNKHAPVALRIAIIVNNYN